MDKLRHAVGAILAVLGTVGLVQIERNRERRLRSPFERHGPRPPVLTEDERSFRQALQHFSLSYPKQLSSLAGHVRAEVIAKIKEAGEHSVQNVGDGAFQLLALENLRPGGGSTAAPMSANGMTLVGESASLRVYDAQLADDNRQISHVHAAPAVAILISGRVLSQGPEYKDKTIGEVASGLKQLDRPGQWVFVPAGQAHYVVRLGADRAQIVEVELR